MPSLIIRPNGEGSTQQWDVSTFERVDDIVTQPDTVALDSNVCEESAAGSDVVQWTTENIPSTSGVATDAYLWVYHSSGFNPPSSTRIKINGSWKGAQTTPGFQTGNWDRFDFTTTENLSSGITGNEIELTANSAGSTEIDAAYIEIVYTSGPPIPPAIGDKAGHWYYAAQQGSL